MSADLIKRLRDEHVSASRNEAADCIEELVEENEELTLQLLAVHGQAADALDRAVVAEAKLGKAVELLREIREGARFGLVMGAWVNSLIKQVRAVLAELEGE